MKSTLGVFLPFPRSKNVSPILHYCTFTVERYCLSRSRLHTNASPSLTVASPTTSRNFLSSSTIAASSQVQLRRGFLSSPTASRLPLLFTFAIFVSLVAKPSFLCSSFSFITRRSSLSLTLIVLPFCNFDISHSKVYLFYIHIASSLFTLIGTIKVFLLPMQFSV